MISEKWEANETDNGGSDEDDTFMETCAISISVYQCWDDSHVGCASEGKGVFRPPSLIFSFSIRKPGEN